MMRFMNEHPMAHTFVLQIRLNIVIFFYHVTIFYILNGIFIVFTDMTTKNHIVNHKPPHLFINFEL